jgi:endogenous inhibitor of DNA gyrase (YacG/DUF329 family)
MDINKLESKRLRTKHGSWTVYRTLCANCGAEVWRRKSQLEKYPRSYCSPGCLFAARRKRITKPCAECGKSVTRKVSEVAKSKTGNVFCSQSCNTKHLNRSRIGSKHPNYNGGHRTYRVKAIRAHGAYCHSEHCELAKAAIEIPEGMLDVHHIDGDRENSDLDNLIVLCVWCHARRTRNIGE